MRLASLAIAALIAACGGDPQPRARPTVEEHTTAADPRPGLDQTLDALVGAPVGEEQLRADARPTIAPPALPEAALFLDELAAAGVVLEQTGEHLATAHDGFVDCALEGDPWAARCRRAPAGAEASPGALDLEPPAWTRPPSRRRPPPRLPRGRPTPPAAELTTLTVARIAAVFDAHPTLSLRGYPLDTTHRLLLVIATDPVPVGTLACVMETGASGSVRACTDSPIDRVEGIAPTPDGGWLAVAETSYGNQRGAARLLATFLVTDEGLVSTLLDLGGVSGDGEACERHPGYCVYFQGSARRARLLSPTCVQWESGTSWTATHVRVGDRWIDETSEPAQPKCATQLEVRGGRFERADCGPPIRGRACSDDEAPIP